MAFIPDHSTFESALSPLLILSVQLLIFLLFSLFWRLLALDCTISSLDAVIHLTAWITSCLPYPRCLLLWHSLPCKSKFPSLALMRFSIPQATEEHVKKNHLVLEKKSYFWKKVDHLLSRKWDGLSSCRSSSSLLPIFAQLCSTTVHWASRSAGWCN